MDRPILSTTLIPYSQKVFEQTNLYDIYPKHGTPVMAHVKLSEKVMRQERLMNNGAQLFPRPLPHQRESTLALRQLLTDIRHGKLPQDVAKQLSIMLRGGNYLAAATFGQLSEAFQHFTEAIGPICRLKSADSLCLRSSIKLSKLPIPTIELG